MSLCCSVWYFQFQAHSPAFLLFIIFCRISWFLWGKALFYWSIKQEPFFVFPPLLSVKLFFLLNYYKRLFSLQFDQFVVYEGTCLSIWEEYAFTFYICNEQSSNWDKCLHAPSKADDDWRVSRKAWWTWMQLLLKNWRLQV